MRFAWLFVLAGCIQSESILCDNGLTCPPGAACDLVHSICVDPDALTACNGLAEAADCAFDQTMGKCEMGVCLVPACANGIVDVGEVCDDRGLAAGDGCSADCRSNETCGNGVADLAIGEACDDGDGVNGDGCADDCTVERPQWIDTSNVAPPPRYFATMAYDPNRNAIILYGGTAGANKTLSDTWEWRGEWNLSSVLLAAPPVYRAASVYEADLGRVMVHGGESPTGSISGAAYLWDGAKWVRGADGPPRMTHAMAYDARRKRVVLFGGLDDEGNAPDTTWEFDGTTWREIATPTRPDGRLYAAMTYDPEKDRILMFGGLLQSDGSYSSELWSYDGVDWTLRSNTGPSGRAGAMFAYDVALHAAVMFGGQLSGGASPETWMVTDETTPVWSQPTVTTSPSARAFGSMVADGHGRLVLFAGSEGGSIATDTLTFDGDWHAVDVPVGRTDGGAAMDVDRRKLVVYGGAPSVTWERSTLGWTQWPTTRGTTAPSGLLGVGLVYDEKNKVVVAFGGMNGVIGNDQPTNETWTWSSATTIWTKANTPTAPPVTRQGQLVWDSGKQRVLLFGPNSFLLDNPPTITSQTTDLWSWDGTSWMKLAPAHVPPPRMQAVVGYDRVRKELVLFGGNNGSAALPIGFDDTWVFDGDDWKEVEPPAGTARPPTTIAGSGNVGTSAMAWNPARATLTLLDANASAWEWTGTRWEQAETPTRPDRRAGFNLVPSFDGHGLTYMFGSSVMTSAYAPWQLRWSGSGATESCHRDVDADGDGKAGCDDPDCWAGCTPHCPPQTTCEPGAPVCGDGTCDSNEDCYTCSDCTCAAVCGDLICGVGEIGCPGDCP